MLISFDSREFARALGQDLPSMGFRTILTIFCENVDCLWDKPGNGRFERVIKLFLASSGRRLLLALCNESFCIYA